MLKKYVNFLLYIFYICYFMSKKQVNISKLYMYTTLFIYNYEK